MKRYSLGFSIRLAAIFLSILLFGWLLNHTTFYLSIGILGLIILAQAIEMISFVNRSNRLISRFLTEIEHNDFTASTAFLSEDKSFLKLHETFARVKERFRQIRIEKEEQFLFLDMLVEHVGVGLLSFTENGHIHLFNSEAGKLLGTAYLSNINALERMHPDLPSELLSIKSGEKKLVEISRNNERIPLSVHSAEFRNEKGKFTLLALQHIGRELGEKEVESWQKLIRVLTHEIMNSLTPVVSLAETAKMIVLEEKENSAAPGEFYTDMLEALSTIENRGKGLLQFVTAYRSFTRMPQPELQSVRVGEFLNKVSHFILPQLKAQGISIEVNCPDKNLDIEADPELLEQVLINILLNARDALMRTPSPRIKVDAFQSGNNKIVILVEDNGCGIPADQLDNVFVPFFTTKPRGSGIGLSLSRQIILAHGGEISLQSVEGEGTKLRILLNG